MKKLYEYKLVSTDESEEYISSSKFHFTKGVAQEHNEQYVAYDVPRKLVRVGVDAIEVPFWWSGGISKFIG